MLREIAHFARISPKVMRLQQNHSRAEFADLMTEQVDAEGFGAIRAELVDGLAGRVLDLGCGTGAMFRYFGDAVRDIEAVEPEDDFRAVAEEKAKAHAGRVRVARGSGMDLDFPNQSFDAVVLGLVLCSVPSVERVVSEIHRVLRPGGELRAIEHVRSERALGGALMDVSNRVWLKMNKQGCNWNRNPVPAIEAQGFVFDEVQAFQRFDMMMPAFPMLRIRARRPASG